MRLGIILSLFRTSASDSFGGIRFTTKKGRGILLKTGKYAPKTHLIRLRFWKIHQNRMDPVSERVGLKKF